MSTISSLQGTQNIPFGTTQSANAASPESQAETGAPKSGSKTEIKKTEEKKDVDNLKKQLTDVTSQLNKEMSSLNFNVKFGFNDKIDQMYVSVMEKDTNKVIRKIPSDDAMKLMDKMREIVGMIFDKKA